jgi:hypothetical protein
MFSTGFGGTLRSCDLQAGSTAVNSPTDRSMRKSYALAGRGFARCRVRPFPGLLAMRRPISHSYRKLPRHALLALIYVGGIHIAHPAPDLRTWDSRALCLE